jgi:hypothetical protein
MNQENRQRRQEIALWVQVGMLGATIVAALVHIGKRDQQLEITTQQVRELSSIVSDLTKTQVGLTLRADQTETRLLEIISRLERLERNK